MKTIQRHDTLPGDLIERVARIKESLSIPYPKPLYEWIDGFKCDLHPEKEIEIWEWIVKHYTDFTKGKRFTLEQHKGILKFYLSSTVMTKEDLERSLLNGNFETK